MRIAIFSDSHGRMQNCLAAMDAAGPVDHIIHLGDTARDAEDLGTVYPETPITYVCGNSEICAATDTEKWIELCGKRLFICHGHTRNVKYGLSELAYAARGADLALFGHTHLPYDGMIGGVRLFNPGSISLPADGRPSFGILTVADGALSTVHKTL